jgi:hypothetical protein
MFTSADLSAMRSTQEAHMLDTCIRQAFSRTYDTYGSAVVTYTDGSAIVCGLDQRPGSERHGPDMTVLDYDATLRLPITTTIDARDRIKVTHRFGEAITNLVYDIAGPVQRGPSGIRLLLKRVET